MRLFWLIFLQYFLIVANTRAFTQGSYAWTAVTDIILLVSGFCTTQIVAKAKNKASMAWYVAGGTLGSQAAIFLTKIFYGN